MAKRKVIFKAGRYYHIYNRGANKNRIFFEDENYFYLIRKLKEYSERFSVSVISYCLMPNHYHLLFRQDGEPALNKMIGFLFNTYTKAINKRLYRTGTLFEGSFKCIEVEDEKYLYELCRYIHRNPVDDKLVENILDWRYSNYHEWVNKRNESLIDKKVRDKKFPGGEGYEKYVSEFFSNKEAKNILIDYLKQLLTERDKE